MVFAVAHQFTGNNLMCGSMPYFILQISVIFNWFGYCKQLSNFRTDRLAYLLYYGCFQSTGALWGIGRKGADFAPGGVISNLQQVGHAEHVRVWPEDWPEEWIAQDGDATALHGAVEGLRHDAPPDGAEPAAVQSRLAQDVEPERGGGGQFVAQRSRQAGEVVAEDYPAEIRHALLEAFDRQQQVGAAARLVARYLLLGHPPEDLLATLAHALLRKDAGFHAFQMLEAGVRQYEEWGATDQGRHVLIAVARYLAAHAPTERSAFQTADIAKRLMRGGRLHEEADEASA